MHPPETVQQKLARLRAQRVEQLKTLSPVPPAPAGPTDSNHSEPADTDSQTESNPDSESNSIAPGAPQTIEEILAHRSNQFSSPITLTPDQQSAVALASQGVSFNLCGSAGTGKTTTTKELISKLKESPHIRRFTHGTKYIQSNSHAIVVTAFTRRATKNIEDAIQDPTITIVNFHKLLQYAPVFFEVVDPLTGKLTKTMRFEPTYHRGNPLPKISTIIIEETSQFSTQLFSILCDALPDRGASTQFIFIGDIQQIPPTMGTSIFEEKLLALPGIELTQVHRQAMGSPIIRFLTDLRNGVPITRTRWKHYTRVYDPETDTVDESQRDDRMRMGVFPANLSWDEALLQASTFLRDEFHSGTYDPYNDMVLVPFNVKFGTLNLNRYIAELIDAKENREVFEIITGFRKRYLSVGDHVLYETEDYIIVDIKHNTNYYGDSPRPASRFMDRSGAITNQAEYQKETLVHDLGVELDLAPRTLGADFQVVDPTQDSESESESESVLRAQMSQAELEAFVRRQIELASTTDKVNESSHIVVVESLDNPERGTIELSSLGDLDKIQLSYAITVHKAQGLQAQRVYFFLHRSHSPMHYRELIYTAASRPQTYLTIICDPEILQRGAKNQRIKGVTLEEKKEYFRKRREEKALDAPPEAEAE